jgi:hypothetical protein
VKKELENQQNIDRLKLEKQYAVRPSTAANRSMMGGVNSSRMTASRMTGRAGNNAPASKPSNK